MKVIDGTPQEIAEYLRKGNMPAVNFSEAVKHSVSLESVSIQRIKNEMHWSNSKQEWVPIKSMNSVYITNILRNLLSKNRGADLLENNEFKSLILNLSDKIKEEL